MSRGMFWSLALSAGLGAALLVATPVLAAGKVGVVVLVMCGALAYPAVLRMRDAGLLPARLVLPGLVVILFATALVVLPGLQDPYASRPVSAAEPLPAGTGSVISAAWWLLLALVAGSAGLLTWWLSRPGKARP